MTELDVRETREMLLAAADAVIAAKPLLTEVDNKIGDGDHGTGMELGMRKAKDALNAIAEPKTVGELFKAMGRAMMMSMGGASGVIFGTMFQGGVKSLGEASVLDAAAARTLFRAALEAIKSRGGASVGDKTMVDALEPAVLAMEECGGDLGEVLSAAADAAAQGVENTKPLVAKFGRAKTLGERAVGYQDAGATSVCILFGAMRDYVLGGRG